MEQPVNELTEFDSLICDSRLQLLKSAIPFIPAGKQRFLSVYVKYIELSNTIRLVNTIKSDSLGICSLSGRKSAPNSEDFMQTIRKYCSESERETLDMITNFMSAYRMFKMYKDSADDTHRSADGSDTAASNGHDNSILDVLKSMLTPEQQEMFDTYSAVLTP